MKRKQIVRKIASFALCLTLAAHGFGWLSPACAANANASATVYTFGNPDSPFRDLAKEHEEEVKQRKKARKKAEQEEAKREKAAMIKAAREAREREKRDKAAKNGAEEGANGEAA